MTPQSNVQITPVARRPAAAVLIVFMTLTFAGATPRASASPEEFVATDAATHALIASRIDTLRGDHDDRDAAALPVETNLDRTAWADRVLHVWLDFDSADPELSPLAVERLHAALAQPLLTDDTVAGLVIHARSGVGESYRSLAEFSGVASIEPVTVPLPNDVPAPAPPPSDDPLALMGPTMQAAAQPSGALSGVTVYVSAGHGWTGGTSSWYLQRPVLLDMVEDYGNIDQLNYFAHYAFNAGATVVPLRPVGWQPIEVVLDEDDPNVTYTTTWSTSTYFKHYENGATVDGISYRHISAAPTETTTARYTATLPVEGFYPVYTFVVASTNRVRQLYRIGHSGGVSEVVVDHREVGNGWIWLGNYHFEVGGPSYVEISNESPDTGVVIADAIRWGCGMGTAQPSGPGTISGYSRDEEAQRYWGETELGTNASGFDSGIWDLPGYSDGSDNVGAGARIAREMNQVPAGGVLADRWKRIHLEFHTNAASGSARGQLCLITTSGATTYQSQFAQILADEVDADLLIADDEFEHAWFDRSSATYTSGYGAISTSNNSDEFDATIIELAFHDNQTDAELLRDPRVRAAMGRASVHGIIRFLNTLPGSQVPLAFAPDTPRAVACEDVGGGDVLLSWQPPRVDGARGDAATEYVIYQSTNGYGFGDPIYVGNVTSHTISNVPIEVTRYYRIAARNAGGESMPSEVLAVRRPDGTAVADVLIVNGYDRLRREINPLQTFTQPPLYAGDTIERQVWRQSNSFDYVVQHADALAANGIGFSSASNEAIESETVALANYAIVDWALGNESAADATLTATEQSLLTTFLQGGGDLFISGSDIGYDLIGLNNGLTFLQSTLQTGYYADDSGATAVYGETNSVFDNIGILSFATTDGAPYEVHTPDRLDSRADSAVCLRYSGGSGGIAGIEFTSVDYNAIVLGFPFETIADPADRTEVMARVIDYLRTASGPLPFDRDNDRDVDFDDFALFQFCLLGPGQLFNTGHICLLMDGNEDMAVDLLDLAMFQDAFTGSLSK